MMLSRGSIVELLARKARGGNEGRHLTLAIVPLSYGAIPHPQRCTFDRLLRHVFEHSKAQG